MKIQIIPIMLLLSLLLSSCGDDTSRTENRLPDTHTEHEDVDGHGHEAETGIIKLSMEQLQAAGVVVSPLNPQLIADTLRAPGEVSLNAYRTVKVTPRIEAQVVARHAKLGDVVEKGQPLVTLSSVEMADAQGSLLVANQEWQRVKKLGREVVSQRRYTEAQVAWEQAQARVQAYGMTTQQIDALLANNKNVQANGTFQLLAAQAGRVLHDAFIVGERVEPGRELMIVADEDVMWVEARITPNEAGLLQVGNAAQVKMDTASLPATVSQIDHALDETTRTLAVRLEVNNPEDKLHPGMFVTAYIQTSNQTNALVVPEAAVLRSPDGDWQVMVEQDEAGEFKAVEVELERVVEGRAIIAGIKPGSRVVTEGAFFVQSELAKSGFEIHNH
jgi:cobalt-zinc-cadmium efflux system membrane fusion protein